MNGFVATPSDPEPPAPREALALIHHHPGRLRVRAECFRGSDAPSGASVIDRVRAALDMEPGITTVSHNLSTGSLLVEYQPGHAHAEAILMRIAAAAGLDLPPDDDRRRGKAPAIVAIDAARELNDLVHEVTGYRADLRSIVPVGLAALAVYSFASRGDRLPRWDNLLYWSYNIFSQLHRREIDGHSAMIGGSAKPEP